MKHFLTVMEKLGLSGISRESGWLRISGAPIFFGGGEFHLMTDHFGESSSIKTGEVELILNNVISCCGESSFQGNRWASPRDLYPYGSK